MAAELRRIELDDAIDGAEIHRATGTAIQARPVEFSFVQSVSATVQFDITRGPFQTEQSIVGAEPQQTRLVLNTPINRGGGQPHVDAPNGRGSGLGVPMQKSP